MDYVRKRNLILITALVYTIFACNYVLLCKKNTGVVNLIECFNSIIVKQKLRLPAVVKNPSQQNIPVANQFLSRPRVIINRVTLPDLSIVAIAFLLLFTFLIKRERFFLLGTLLSISPSPGIIFLRNLRI